MTSKGDGGAGEAHAPTGPVSFVGHESFPLRYGWLKKCVDAVAARPDAFAHDDAMVSLGVGKNMVKAIRHWGLITRVIEVDPDGAESRGRSLRVTPLGNLIFGEGGADPYLEDPRTLWLVHWLLCTHPERATTWRWVFGVWGRHAFTREELRIALKGLAAGARASEATIGRDAEVFLRSYLPSRASRGAPLEDALDSPLIELQLLREDPVEGRCEFVRGPKPSLDDTVFAFTVLDYWERTAGHSESMHADALAHGPSSPGRVLCLDERSLYERLEFAEAWSRGALLFDQTAGVRQLRRKRKVDAREWLAQALSSNKGSRS